MIDWDAVGKLHVINKLSHIIHEWYGVELIWTGTQHKIQSGHLEKGYNLKNSLFKMQLEMNAGVDMLVSDIENVNDELKHLEHDDKKLSTFKSSIPHVHGLAVAIVIDGEKVGSFVAYPFLKDDASEGEKREVVEFLKDHGVSEQDALSTMGRVKFCNGKDLERLHDLVELAAQEVVDFSKEVVAREDRIKALNSELGNRYRYHTMIGKSKKMQQVYHLLDKISNSDSSLFIQGENGTGKELVAKAVHYFSPRKDNIFLAVNCSALNDNLLDSELFGHVKGSFTGAVRDKRGLFEQANGGTLFLDEIGDTSLAMQVKLLRVLQEGTYLPVGSTHPKRCDVRILAATNQPISDLLETGQFREDLYYRINVINISLPPLRDRTEDIPLLIDYFMKRRCDELGIPMKTFTKMAMEKIIDHSWPGNVRELQNEVERAVVLSGQDKCIGTELLSSRIVDSYRPVDSGGDGVGINTSGKLKDALDELETIMIREGLERCSFNKSRLSKELGISRSSLISKVSKYGLDKRKKAVGE